MEAFDPSMFPHLAYLLPLTEGQDSGASVTEAFPDPSGDPLPCRVRFKGPRIEYRADQEATVTPVDVAFPADPVCKKGDRFQRTPAARLLRALGPAQARDGDGVLFVVQCEAID